MVGIDVEVVESWLAIRCVRGETLKLRQGPMRSIFEDAGGVPFI